MHAGSLSLSRLPRSATPPAFTQPAPLCTLAHSLLECAVRSVLVLRTWYLTPAVPSNKPTANPSNRSTADPSNRSTADPSNPQHGSPTADPSNPQHGSRPQASAGARAYNTAFSASAPAGLRERPDSQFSPPAPRAPHPSPHTCPSSPAASMTGDRAQHAHHTPGHAHRLNTSPATPPGYTPPRYTSPKAQHSPQLATHVQLAAHEQLAAHDAARQGWEDSAGRTPLPLDQYAHRPVGCGTSAAHSPSSLSAEQRQCGSAQWGLSRGTLGAIAHLAFSGDQTAVPAVLTSPAAFSVAVQTCIAYALVRCRPVLPYDR